MAAKKCRHAEGTQDSAASIKALSCFVMMVCFLLLVSGCGKNAAETIDHYGFQYDGQQDIYVSKIDTWQRKMGYSSFLDSSAVSSGMVIDCEPVQFEYNGKRYMIEMWKGQYDLSTGAEIGIYRKASAAAASWECGDNKDMLDMSYSLKKNGKGIFNRRGHHWWLTGFKPGEFSNPEDLTMDIAINFDSQPGMLNAFINGLKQTGYDGRQLTVDKNTIRFRFGKPKTPQPIIDPATVADAQKQNKSWVDMYAKAKKDAGVSDNSPASVDKMMGQMPDLFAHLLKDNMKK